MNIPLANDIILGPDNCTNSLIQSMAVNCMRVFVDWAWLIKMFIISDISVPPGSLFMAFRNSHSNVTHLGKNHDVFFFYNYKIASRVIILRCMDFDTVVVQHLKKPIQNFGQIDDHIYFRHCVQHGNPRDDELASKWIFRVDSFPKQRNECIQVKRLRWFRYDIF